MTDRQILIENHNDYMLEIKLNHFKNELTLLVENLIQLDSETRTNNVGMPLSPIKSSKHRKILLNIITNGEELVKEFKVLQEKFEDFENNETHINNKNLKKQIDNLKNLLKEADSKIYELDNQCKTENDIVSFVQKENSALIEKIDKYKKTLKDYEVSIQSKNYELNKYKELVDTKSNEINILNTRLHTTINLQNDVEDNPDIVIPINDSYRLSKDYMIKLNEGNVKLINQKNERIKILEDDINGLQQKIEYYESKITELEKCNITLENTISGMDNSKQNPSSEIPLSIEMELNSKTEEITSLKYKIQKLEKDLFLQAQNNLSTPLLTVSPQTNNKKCLGCSIL
jgi:chromosome segregation ATPase